MFRKYYKCVFLRVGGSNLYIFSCLQPRVVERHFLDLGKRYGSVTAVDLVNKVFPLLLGAGPSTYYCLLFFCSMSITRFLNDTFYFMTKHVKFQVITSFDSLASVMAHCYCQLALYMPYQ